MRAGNFCVSRTNNPSVTSFGSTEYFLQRSSLYDAMSTSSGSSPMMTVKENAATTTTINNNNSSSKMVLNARPLLAIIDKDKDKIAVSACDSGKGSDSSLGSSANSSTGHISPSTSSSSINTKGLGLAIDDYDLAVDRNDGFHSDEVVVSFRDANKSYGKGKKNRKKVLDNLNMTVEKGIIYGLLGASGSGKTTVLSCAVGKKWLDEGQVSIFGGTPGDRGIGVPGRRVGYMPQELALYLEFTIQETLSYFGNIYKMDKADVKKEAEFLWKLLDLPKQKSRLISNMSGGQQRRVSFAVSLLHNPELLILDEPTVGVDPMLRQSIWKHLVKLVREDHKTIIITTHYIEEARQANVVGLMRNGRLLEEDAPEYLMEQYGRPTLEEVFLELCCMVEDEQQQQANKEDQDKAIATLQCAKDKLHPSSYLHHQKQQDRGLGGLLPCSRHQYQNLGFVGSGVSLVGNGNGLGGGIYPASAGATARTDDSCVLPISYKGISDNGSSNDSRDSHHNGPKTISRKRRNNLPSANKPSKVSSSFSNFFVLPSLFIIWAVMCKNYIKLKRNYGQLAFVFLLPAIQVVFFCVAIGRPPTGLLIAVVNHELSPYVYNNDYNNSNSTNNSYNSSSFEPLEGLQYNCPVAPGCNTTNLSCRLYDNIFNGENHEDQPLVPVFYPDEASARAAVRSGHVWGTISTPSNFSKYFLQRLTSSIDVEVDIVERSKITVNLDHSNQQVLFVIQQTLHERYEDFFKGILSNCSFPEGAGDLPMVFGSPVYGPERANFTDFMAPGIILLIVFFLALALTGELFITEKRDGLLDRSWIGGVLASEVLIAHTMTQFVIIVGQSATTLIFILLVFGIPCAGPVGWLIGLTLLQGTAGMCYGMLLSTLFTDLATSMQMSIGSFYPNLLLSGILWPVEGMPWFLQQVAWYLPCTAACQAMRDIMSRGWGITEPTVYMGYVSSVCWIMIFLLAALAVIKLKSN